MYIRVERYTGTRQTLGPIPGTPKLFFHQANGMIKAKGPQYNFAS
jgi:hypothetical protein